MKQGTKANKSGHRLEDKVENLILNNLDVVARRYSQTEIRKNVLLKHVPYTNCAISQERYASNVSFKNLLVRLMKNSRTCS